MSEFKQSAKQSAREEAVVHAVASARIEGVELDDETTSVLDKWATGQMTNSDLDEWVEEQVREATAMNAARSGRKAGGLA